MEPLDPKRHSFKVWWAAFQCAMLGSSLRVEPLVFFDWSDEEPGFRWSDGTVAAVKAGIDT